MRLQNFTISTYTTVISTEETTLLDLVEGAQGNDASACEELCRRMYTTLEKWIYSMVNERHRDVKVELVAEILQESWIQIQRKVHQFRGDTEGAFMGWSYRVTFATTKNYLKKYVRISHREEAVEHLPHPEDLDHSSPDARSILIHEEKLAQVREAVKNIKNERHREAIVLFFFAELSQKEIAEKLGATESAVSTWVYRGKAELTQILEGMGLNE